jgi:hypothetical protein
MLFGSQTEPTLSHMHCTIFFVKMTDPRLILKS